jgi:hypothetical protein
VNSSGKAARTAIKSKGPVLLPAAVNFVSSTASSDRRRHLRRIESKVPDRSGSSSDAWILLFAEKTFARQSNAEWLTTDYDFDVAANIWRRPSPQAAWRYSDGDEAEQRLADIVNSASDQRRFAGDREPDNGLALALSPRRQAQQSAPRPRRQA